MSYVLAHTRLGFCILDILALIILVGIIVYIAIKSKKTNEIKKDLEDRLSDLYADDSMREVPNTITE